MKRLAGEVVQIAYGVHKCCAIGLFKVEWQKPLKVFDEDGFCVGDYFVDMLVNDKLIVELKAVKNLAPEHFAQILNYLKITHNPIGLIINFGSYKFERRTITA